MSADQFKFRFRQTDFVVERAQEQEQIRNRPCSRRKQEVNCLSPKPISFWADYGGHSGHLVSQNTTSKRRPWVRGSRQISKNLSHRVPMASCPKANLKIRTFISLWNQNDEVYFGFSGKWNNFWKCSDVFKNDFDSCLKVTRRPFRGFLRSFRSFQWCWCEMYDPFGASLSKNVYLPISNSGH